MDVTQQTLNYIQSMGGSGSSNPDYYSSSKSLNYAKDSNNINNAVGQRVTAIPYILNYKDSVGLFGAENIFVKVDLNIQSTRSAFGNIDQPINTYYPVWTFNEAGTTNFYTTAEFDYRRDLETVNTYEPARASNDLSQFRNAIVSVDLKNLKTGNKYIDSWFDVRAYDRNKEEIAEDYMYFDINDYFYLGFHARNTRRLPYNVEVTIGNEFLERHTMTPQQRKLFIG